MEKEKAIEVMNSLIVINNDRIEGYDTAAKETDEQDLRTLFSRLAKTSHNCKQELVIEITRLGGEVAEGTKVSGKFFRVWMDVKAALTGKDRKAILSSCEFGEDKAQATYDNAIKDGREHLTEEQFNMVREQQQLLRADHDHVKAMRDALIEA